MHGTVFAANNGWETGIPNLRRLLSNFEHLHLHIRGKSRRLFFSARYHARIYPHTTPFSGDCLEALQLL